MCENDVFSAPDGQLNGEQGKRTGGQMREEDGDGETHRRRGQTGRWEKMQDCVEVERHCGVVDGREWVIEIKI